MNYLAIDIGGTFIKYAVITENCSILEKDKTPTKQDSLEIFRVNHFFRGIDVTTL